MKHLLGLALMIFGAIVMSAQESSPLHIPESMPETVNGESHTEEAISMTTQDQMVSGLSQQISFDYKQTKEWKRYKIMRAVGWSALGVGIPMFWLCAFGSYAEGYEQSNSTSDLLCGLAYVGGGLAIASIPILIVAYRYRYLAKKKISVGISGISTPTPNNIGRFYAPAISFAITF